MTDAIRTTNKPLQSTMLELLGHYDAGGGAKALGRIAADDLQQQLFGKAVMFDRNQGNDFTDDDRQQARTNIGLSVLVKGVNADDGNAIVGLKVTGSASAEDYRDNLVEYANWTRIGPSGAVGNAATRYLGHKSGGEVCASGFSHEDVLVGGFRPNRWYVEAGNIRNPGNTDHTGIVLCTTFASGNGGDFSGKAWAIWEWDPITGKVFMNNSQGVGAHEIDLENYFWTMHGPLNGNWLQFHTSASGGQVYIAALPTPGHDTAVEFVLASYGAAVLSTKSNGNYVATFKNDASNAVNWWQFGGSSTASALTVQAVGADTGIAIWYGDKNGLGHNFLSSGQRVVLIDNPSGSLAGYLRFRGAPSGQIASISIVSSDTDAALRLNAQGHAGIYFASNSNYGLGVINATNTTVNWPEVSGSIAGGGVVYSANGSDLTAGINIIIRPVGTSGTTVVEKGLSLAGSSSGATAIAVAAAASGTWTLPSVTDQFVGRATTDTLSNKTWNGIKIGLAYGGTNADLSATGGTSQVLMQASSGAAVTVAQLAASNLSNGTTGAGAVALAASPTFTGTVAVAALNASGIMNAASFTVGSSSDHVIYDVGTGVMNIRAGASGVDVYLTMDGPNATIRSGGSLLGNSGNRWANVYSTLLNISSTATFGGAATFAGVSTTASAANAFLDNASSNNLLRSTSSLRYKTDIRRLCLNDALAVLDLEPIRFKSLATADDPERDFDGLAAEEVARIFPQFVNFTKDGKPDGVQYDRIGAVVLPMIVKDHHTRLADLTAELAAAQDRIAVLEQHHLH